MGGDWNSRILSRFFSIDPVVFRFPARIWLLFYPGPPKTLMTRPSFSLFSEVFGSLVKDFGVQLFILLLKIFQKVPIGQIFWAGQEIFVSPTTLLGVGPGPQKFFYLLFLFRNRFFFPFSVCNKSRFFSLARYFLLLVAFFEFL